MATKRLSKWQVLLIEMCLHRTQADQVAQVADEVLKLGRTPKLFLANFDQLAAPLSTLGLQWRVDNLARAASTFFSTAMEGSQQQAGVGLNPGCCRLHRLSHSMLRA